MEPQPCPLLEGLKEPYRTGLYSDLTIICGGQSFKVHKIVLQALSPVFRGMLGGEFKEASQKEITLEHDEPDILASMLHFFYNTEVLPAAAAATAAAQNTIKAEGAFLVQIYAIADKYDVPSLRTEAMSRLSLALLERKPNHLKDLILTIRAIDEHTADNTLWRIAIPGIVADLVWLAHDNEFSVLLQELPSLTKALLIGTVNGLDSDKAKSAFAQDVMGYLDCEEDINYHGIGGVLE
ncbi:hypothetical protein LTR17_025067 [Elasticomyces elasticus]|nr:hypothetical protein LTR17_025067 [Elasticomyces elasticus]